ncbi:MAG: ATP-binding cassette domain-containing protein [Alphaproteobacteria bacterium TMED93]|nr:MAG: ATP-binding cassette domain-containing protein [Alphaproteobacteria bacterium TMED93]
MIRLENLSINLKNSKILISNINIFIPSGTLVSITGDPASGKTKLYKVFGLQEKADSGNLYILGKNTNKLNRNEIAKLHNEISLIDESNDLINSLGVKDNIILPLISTNKKKDEIEIAVKELISWLKIDKILAMETVDLSQYEKRMVQFARAIITRPRILLLDSFFINLDTDLQKKISYLLLALKKIGTTIITFSADINNSLLEYDECYKIKNFNLVKL